MSKSILPELLDDLERYLDQRAQAWLDQDGERMPTLPSTSDGKVNVRAITAALGRPQSQEQHLFKKAELRSAINAVAIEQKLKPIGGRLQSEELDKAVADRMRRTDMRASEMSRSSAAFSGRFVSRRIRGTRPTRARRIRTETSRSATRGEVSPAG